MNLSKTISGMICGLAISVGTAAAAQSWIGPTGQDRPSDQEIFTFGRNAAYAHSMDLMGIPRSHTAPAGTTMDLFYTQAPDYRAPYINGVVFGFAHIASIMGQRETFKCFQKLAPVSVEVLDTIYSSQGVPARSGMVGTLRSLCLSNDALAAMARR